MRTFLTNALTLTLSAIDTRQEEETNLDCVEVEVGTWELGLDDTVPELEHWGAVSDIG